MALEKLSNLSRYTVKTTVKGQWFGLLIAFLVL